LHLIVSTCSVPGGFFKPIWINVNVNKDMIYDMIHGAAEKPDRFQNKITE
jgi:hypothetical protein